MKQFLIIGSSFLAGVIAAYVGNYFREKRQDQELDELLGDLMAETGEIDGSYESQA